jgi:hypothetical protein
VVCECVDLVIFQITLRWYDGSEIEMDHLQAAIDLRNFQTAILTEEEIK